MGAGLYERRLVPWADDVPCAAGWHTPLLASRFGGTNRQNRARPSSSNSTLSRRRRINDRPYCKVATFSQARAEIILGIFPWCFTPELYAAKPEYIASLAGFVRQRPRQPVDAFLRQSDAVIGHDAEAQLGRIKAPTQITFGRQHASPPRGSLRGCTRASPARRSWCSKAARTRPSTRRWPSSTPGDRWKSRRRHPGWLRRARGCRRC